MGKSEDVALGVVISTNSPSQHLLNVIVIYSHFIQNKGKPDIVICAS